jgi:hypothetical protein
MVIGEKQKERRRYFALLRLKHESNNFMSLIHTDEAHKQTLNPEPGVVITDFLKKEKGIFDEYPELNPKSVFEKYEKDEENGVKRIKWDVIPAEQYHNLLRRYMEMGELARIPRDVVVGWFNKLKRNTVILYYISCIYHRKHDFPFEVVPFETDNVIEAQLWIYVNTNFYNWATFSNGGPAYSDRAFEQLFPLIKSYRENMTPEEILILINRIIQVSHPSQIDRDFTECFIEGGRETCNKITNG